MKYLRRVNFFNVLEKAKGLPQTGFSPYTGQQERLIEMESYRYKPEFETAAKRLYSLFQRLGLSDQSTSLLVASISEVADNAFLHNLGKWPTSLGPLLISFVQDYPALQELVISLCDFGVGFLATLKSNYPDLRDERSAIELAVQPSTTSRLTRQGGNGLYFLRKNVFNGLKGTLRIRSGNTLARITSEGKAETLDHSIPSSFGAHVEFRIKH